MRSTWKKRNVMNHDPECVLSTTQLDLDHFFHVSIYIVSTCTPGEHAYPPPYNKHIPLLIL